MLSAFQHLRQARAESVAQYSDRFEHLRARLALYDTYFPSAIALRSFLQGLRRHLRIFVYDSHPTSLEEAKEIAQYAEDYYSDSAAYSPAPLSGEPQYHTSPAQSLPRRGFTTQFVFDTPGGDECYSRDEHRQYLCRQIDDLQRVLMAIKFPGCDQNSDCQSEMPSCISEDTHFFSEPGSSSDSIGIDQ